MEVASIDNKVRGRHKWFGCVQCRSSDALVGRSDLIHVEGMKRCRRRRKIIRDEVVRED